MNSMNSIRLVFIWLCVSLRSSIVFAEPNARAQQILRAWRECLPDSASIVSYSVVCETERQVITAKFCARKDGVVLSGESRYKSGTIDQRAGFAITEATIGRFEICWDKKVCTNHLIDRSSISIRRKEQLHPELAFDIESWCWDPALADLIPFCTSVLDETRYTVTVEQLKGGNVRYQSVFNEVPLSGGKIIHEFDSSSRLIKYAFLPGARKDGAFVMRYGGEFAWGEVNGVSFPVKCRQWKGLPGEAKDLLIREYQIKDVRFQEDDSVPYRILADRIANLPIGTSILDFREGVMRQSFSRGVDSRFENQLRKQVFATRLQLGMFEESEE